MNNFKGTKGKWVITEGYPNGVEIDAIRIQTLYDPMWDIAAVWDDLDSDQSKANALLISKAPEMLEMLEYLVENDYIANLENVQKVKQLIKEATKL